MIIITIRLADCNVAKTLMLQFSQTLFKLIVCQTLHDGSAYRALPIHTTFSDLHCISRSLLCQTVLTKKLMFLSN